MSIKPISASWDCKSEKTDTYRLLNMIHAMAGLDAQNEKSIWKLKSTATYSNFVITTWTNGLVDVIAETNKDCDGLATNHSYKMIESTI